MALAIAASLASGIKANFGTMTKPLHVGHSRATGCSPRCWRARVSPPTPDAFEHQQGFLDVFNGPGTYDARRVLRDWGAPFDIVAPGIAHQAVSRAAAAPIRRSTRCSISCARMTSRPTRSRASTRGPMRGASRTPTGPTPQARSTRSSACSTASRARSPIGTVLDHFEARRLFRPGGRALMARIEAAQHPDMPDASPPIRRRGDRHDHRQPPPRQSRRHRARTHVGEPASARGAGGEVSRLRGAGARCRCGRPLARCLANLGATRQDVVARRYPAVGCRERACRQLWRGRSDRPSLSKRLAQTGERNRGNAMELGRRRLLALIAAAVAPVGSRVARADAYPSRPVHWIVGFAPGGSTDILRPGDRAVSVGEARPDLRHREPARRGEQHRDRGRRRMRRPTATRC